MNKISGIAVVTLMSLIFMQVMTTQSKVDDSNLLLFNRLTSLRNPPDGILLMDVNTGETTQLSTGRLLSAMSWSPNGDRILGLQTHENEWVARVLVIMDGEGRNRQPLTDTSLLDPHPRALWSADGTQIFFWGRDLQVEKDQPRFALYSVVIDGGTPRRLTEPTSPFPQGALSLSPDGTHIIFSQHGKLYTMALDGKDLRPIDVPLHISTSLMVSPDGELLAALAPTPEQTSGIYVMKPDGSQLRLLETNVGDVHGIHWSPDSSEILFRVYARSGSALTIGIVNIETDAVETYDVGEGVLESLLGINEAIWSPDGTQIVFAGIYRENNPYRTNQNLYLVDRHFTQIQRLTDARSIDRPVQWRPR